MQRRHFLKKTAAASAAGFSALGTAVAVPAAGVPAAGEPFKLLYAPHIGMFSNSAGEDPLAQIQFMYDVGFRAMEDNGMMGRTPEMQQKIGDLMAKLGMKMGVFVMDAGDNWKTSYATGKKEFNDRFITLCKNAIETARRCHATNITFVPGYFERNLPIGIQTGHVIDTLRRGAELLEPQKLTMVLEPLSDNPDLFLRTSDQTYMICRAVNSPACKVLFDVYHMQRNEGHIIPHMDWCWDEIGYFQIGDNPGRKEPGTGEINYQNVFKHIYEKARAAGKTFILGMEHGNAFAGKEGEQKLIAAYRQADAFKA